MASALDERLAESGYEQLWEQLASLVTYVTTATNATATINAIFSEQPAQLDYAVEGVARLRVAHVELRTTGLDAVANPVRNDTVTVEGELWTVARELDSRPGWKKIEVTRMETIAKGNPYKERR